MSKNKRKRTESIHSGHKKPHGGLTQTTAHGPAPTKPPKPSRQQRQEQHSEPVIPFDASERILLVGEGDLSFANSLSTHHVCTDLTATVYDCEAATLEKYPQAGAHVARIREDGGTVLFGVDATRLHVRKDLRRPARAADGFERIIFNFPHVGGKSTDVNRQVRYNQELLVAFFKSAVRLLTSARDVRPTIIVTLFESEPYTLWNIRDLARHSGLQVQRSFKFRAEAYPGYAHVRTLGNIAGGGGWKGEDRAARSYIFEVKGTDLAAGEHASNTGLVKAKKRKRDGHDDSDSESDGG